MDLIYNFIIYKIIIPLIVFILAYFVLFLFWCGVYRLKGFKRLKGEYKYVGYGSKLKRLFIDFPKQLAYDYLTFDPDTFRDYGFHLLTGKQGSGKTITLVYLLRRYQKMYPKLVVKTNMNYKYEQGEITHWKDLVFSNNGIYGEIDVIDEVQNWFSSNQSKDFPPDMLQEITQQRKQRKMIIGTSQVFTRVAKPIRENVYLVYEPRTIFGCLTIVKKYEPIMDDKGTVVQQKPRGMFFFVHTKEIRDSFDTYKKIEKLAQDGFVNRNEQIQNIYKDENYLSSYLSKIS